MKTFVTIVGGVLLALSCVTASDTRPHNERLRPNQAEVFYNHPMYHLNLSDDVSPAPEQDDPENLIEGGAPKIKKMNMTPM